MPKVPVELLYSGSHMIQFFLDSDAQNAGYDICCLVIAYGKTESS